MTAHVEQSDRAVVTPEMLEAMRQGEADGKWLREHPAFLEPYRGQWVVVHKRQIVAHSRDGREVARQANSRLYPGALLEYVPTREEAEAIHVYTPFFGPRPDDDSAAGSHVPGDEPSKR